MARKYWTFWKPWSKFHPKSKFGPWKLVKFWISTILKVPLRFGTLYHELVKVGHTDLFLTCLKNWKKKKNCLQPDSNPRPLNPTSHIFFTATHQATTTTTSSLNATQQAVSTTTPASIPSTASMVPKTTVKLKVGDTASPMKVFPVGTRILPKTPTAFVGGTTTGSGVPSG